jgi:hypothetical protein
MLTQADIKEIERIVEEKIEEKTKPLPTKDQFFQRMDDLSGQMKKIQETLDLHDGQHSAIHDHQDDTDARLNVIEEKLAIPHPIAS